MFSRHVFGTYYEHCSRPCGIRSVSETERHPCFPEAQVRVYSADDAKCGPEVFWHLNISLFIFTAGKVMEPGAWSLGQAVGSGLGTEAPSTPSR